MKTQQKSPLTTSEVTPPATILDSARKQVIEAFSRDIRSETVVLIHGTCLSSVNRALETGTIPGGFPNTSLGESYIYLYNIPERLPFESAKCSLPKDGKEALNGAKFYAQTSAMYFDACANLGVDPSRPEVYTAIEMAWSEGKWTQNRASIYERAGINRSDVERLADFLKGKESPNMVILGFDRALLSEFTLQEARKNDDGLRIATPDGIPIKYLHSIEPLTRHAFKYLGSLSTPEDPISLSGNTLPRVF